MLCVFRFSKRKLKKTLEKESQSARVCFFLSASKKVKRERIFTHKNAHSEKKKLKHSSQLKLVDRKKKEMDARKIY